jgi:hypothetical protein
LPVSISTGIISQTFSLQIPEYFSSVAYLSPRVVRGHVGTNPGNTLKYCKDTVSGFIALIPYLIIYDILKAMPVYSGLVFVIKLL